MSSLSAFLGRHRRIALDTSVFIYQLEANPRYEAITDRIFKWIEQPGHSAITSTITMTELLVQPYRNSDSHRVKAIYRLLSIYPNLEWIAPNLEIAETAARMRAQYGMRTPDALHAATVARARVAALVTNDSVFERVEAFEALLLDNLL